MGLLLALLLAAPASHRATAARAETLGHMQEAAREYEAAWSEEHAPDLLYRLGLVRRKLKRYALAREAFRAYLRDAPDGALRDEVVRQLAKLEVLLEAQSEDFADPAAPRRAPSRSAPPAHQPSPPAASSLPPATTPPAVASPPAASSPPPAPSPPGVSTPPPVSTPPAISAPPPAPSLPAAPAAATPAALAGEPVAVSSTGRSRVAPWLLGGAAAATAAGAYFWYDSSRLSRDLDARFAAGDLSAADRPAYSRAHGESVAGRLLLISAAALAAGAVALWW